MNEDTQYESGTSSVQVRMCSTRQGRSSVLAQGVLSKIASNEWVITLTNISGENGQ